MSQKSYPTPTKKICRAKKFPKKIENEILERNLKGYDPHPLSEKLSLLIKDYEKILSLIKKNLNDPPQRI